MRAAAVSIAPALHAEPFAVCDHLPSLGERVEAMDDALLVGRLDRSSIRRLVERGRQPGTKLVEAGPVVGADTDGAGKRSVQLRPRVAHLGKVELRHDQRHRPLGERRIVQSQLLGDRLPLLHRLSRGAVDDTDKDPGAFDVAQELVAQALPLVGALDQPGHVRDDREPLSVGIERDHAEVRADRRERVGPDFGPGLGERRQQRRLAGVWRADQADVGDELQLELHPALLAGRALLGVARRAVGRRREAGISATAATAAGDDEAGIGIEQLADPFAFGMRCG